ncbi:MAG: GAF domain-containing protein [Candidatus Peribacteraceae bacterium]|nr:GAF domain-containing protein [Candidatus Peribacteraceae bacterium]
MNFSNYLNIIGLSNLTEPSQTETLNEYVCNWFERTLPSLINEEIEKLYTYLVPKLGVGSSCSIFHELEKMPYDLTRTFGLTKESLRQHWMTLRLWRLNRIIDSLYSTTGVDWIGIYRSVTNTNGERVLVKEAYRGAPSRAEFPLTEEFAKNSNNSTVGLTGKAICFQDIEEYLGPYYKCDSKVQSEFCVPILNSKGAVTGIIDAESFHTQHFTNERLLQIAKVCFDLGKIDPFF